MYTEDCNCSLNIVIQCYSLYNIKNIHHIDKPSAPSKPKVETSGKNTIKITWKAPSTDGGTPVTGYFIERKIGQSGRWDTINEKVGFDVDSVCSRGIYQGCVPVNSIKSKIYDEHLFFI